MAKKFDEFGFRAAAEQAGYKKAEVDDAVNQINGELNKRNTLDLIQSGAVPLTSDYALAHPTVAKQALDSGAKIEVKKSADEEKKLSSKKNAENVVNQLEDLYFGKLGDNKDDLSYGRLGGILPSIGAAAGMNVPLTTYRSTRESVKPTLARAAGDVGALSEQEQLAAVKQLPTEYSTQAEAMAGFKALRQRLGLSSRDLTKAASTRSTGGVSKYTIEQIE